MGYLDLLLRPAKRNLMEVLKQLPEFGVGKRVTRETWAAYGNSYWEITSVKPRKTTEDGGFHGKVYGIKVWKGVPETSYPVMVRSRTKRVWQWMPKEDEKQQLEPILRRMRAAQEARQQQQAAAAAAAEGGSSAGSSQ